MSYETTIKKSVANTAGAMTEIKTRLEAMGWTTHDDQSGGSPPYYVFSSDGESGNFMTGYLKMTWNNTTDRIETDHYIHWDNSTHSGTTRIYASTHHDLVVDDDASFELWIYGNKDQVIFLTLISGSYDEIGFHHVLPFYKTEGTLTSTVSSGSSVVLTVGSGETSGFVVGREYRVVGSGSGEGSEKVQVTSINTGSNQITVDSLTRGLSAGSMIGVYPFRWCLRGGEYFSSITSTYSGTGNISVSTAQTITYLIDENVRDPSGFSDLYDLAPFLFWDSGDAARGYSNANFAQVTPDPTSENTISVGDLDSGTATSGTSTTLTDTGQSWATDEYQNKCLIITGGTGAGQIRNISSNTSTTLTVPTFDTTPDGTSEYVICEKGYRHFYFSTLVSFAVLEVG